MKNYIFILLLLFLSSCFSKKATDLPSPSVTAGKLKINCSFENITNARTFSTDDIYLRVIQNVTNDANWSYYTEEAIFDDRLAVDNAEIVLEAGSYDNLLISSEEWSKNLIETISADNFIKDPFKIWKARKSDKITITAEITSIANMTLEPQHCMVEFFVEPGTAIPSEVDHIEYVIKGWFMDFNTGVQSFTTKSWTTSDNSQYVDNNSTFITLNLTQDSGETILPPFALFKDGEEDKGGITIKLFNADNKMIWQDGIYNNLNVNWGEKFNVYYNPEIVPEAGAIRATMVSWFGLEEINVYIKDE